uniref:Uncharacterized protein n=1 Tax=Myoviridae sp. ctJ2i1 TaxID=2825079 RepID=A0A8S5V1Z6_9CAUD|nr:MAG TPA: hypothetical protein [Myoviridae sp. ctJ2i1]
MERKNLSLKSDSYIRFNQNELIHYTLFKYCAYVLFYY